MIVYVLICALIGLCIARFYSARQRASTQPASAYNLISRHNGDWQSADPWRIISFKGVYHLTMGLQACTLSDLVLMDKSYSAKIKLRRELIAREHDTVIGSNAVADEAVQELYQWLFAVYLPQRLPDAFQRIGKESKTSSVQNLITKETICLDKPLSAKQRLAIIGRHVDCEFAILLPTAHGDSKPFRAEPTADNGSIYHLHAFVLVFPSSFNTPRKLGLGLAEIHAPVPGYGSKLEMSMNRYFASLPFEKVVQRTNWSVSTDGVLFKPGNAHAVRPATREQEPTATPHKPAVVMAPAQYEPTAQETRDWQEASKAVDPLKCSLRMERQTLHRLEKTGALVFGFKTVLKPLSEFKQEGLGPVVADALDGLRKGTVPAIDVYKDGVIWRKPLIEYLTA